MNGYTDEFFMKAALKEVTYAVNKEEVPVGAVIVCNNSIIARAHNMTETLNDVTAHAEMQAITSATDYLGGKYLKECTIYVTLEPCVMCAGAIFWSQAARLVYAASDPKRGFTLFNPLILHPSTKISKGILEDEASLLLRDFFKKKRL